MARCHAHAVPYAFVPVVEISRREVVEHKDAVKLACEPTRSSPPVRALAVDGGNAQRRNASAGLTGQDAALVSAIIETLGRSDVHRLDAKLKVYFHREAVDFRKSINGLAALVEQSMGLDPFAAALYAFSYRRRDRIKILGWGGNGFWLLMNYLASYYNSFNWM